MGRIRNETLKFQHEPPTSNESANEELPAAAKPGAPVGAPSGRKRPPWEANRKRARRPAQPAASVEYVGQRIKMEGGEWGEIVA